VPPRKNQNKAAEAIVAHATVEAIAAAGKVAGDVVAHKAAVKVAAAIQNQRTTVAPQAASKKARVNAVIAVEVVIAKFRLTTTPMSNAKLRVIFITSLSSQKCKRAYNHNWRLSLVALAN
jgi:hypothetical protein